MALATIEIQVDERAARVYTEASEEEREKLQSLLSIWLQEFDDAADDLLPLMEEIGARARERGMTPDILETLLRDDPRVPRSARRYGVRTGGGWQREFHRLW